MMPPSCHDLHVTTRFIARTSIFNLPYGYHVLCTRVSGWVLYRVLDSGREEILAGEYEKPGKWLRLDVAGHVIVDSSDRQEEP